MQVQKRIQYCVSIVSRPTGVHPVPEVTGSLVVVLLADVAASVSAKSLALLEEMLTVNLSGSIAPTAIARIFRR